MIYIEKPQGFNPKFEVVSCFIEYKGKIILLHRQDHKSEGNTWGVPGGKVEKEEKLLDAVTREITEETGLQIQQSQIFYFEKVFIRFPTYDFLFHIYHTELENNEKIVINNDEHKDFKWVSPKKALKMNLIQDEDLCIKLFYNI